MILEKEIRAIQEGSLKATEETDKGRMITGYALKFGTRSQNLGGFIETIEKRALQNADMSDVRALIDHDPSKILGRTKAGTLKLTVDDIGLRFELSLPNTQYANDLYENLRLGNISNCSFGFHLAKNGDSFKRDEKSGLPLRSLTNISRITDVSIVTYPAYEDTDVSIAQRHLKQHQNNHLEKEKIKFELELIQLSL
ncbi:HK97 family phage prohead protease [Bacillus stratosphericus]|uniref:HK97 family phage prohead protease n=1 Tax=Bacillus altitudinis TaxID=293387 RepID=UPI002B2DE171|nr:HK97 family phage prohead protease [Bacillus stratosphericus]